MNAFKKANQIKNNNENLNEKQCTERGQEKSNRGQDVDMAFSSNISTGTGMQERGQGCEDRDKGVQRW